MGEFKIDIILSSLKELEQEKRRLETRLSNEKSKRKDLEAKAELVNSRHRQMNEKYNKMLETRSVARRRVTETQNQVDRLQCIHETKQCSIAELKQKVQSERDQQQENLQMFEEELFRLRDKLVDAYKENSDEALAREITDLERIIMENKEKVTKHMMSIEDLDKKLKNTLTLNPEESSNDPGCFPAKQPWEELTEDDLISCLALFSKENELAKEKLLNLNNQVAAQKERLNNITNKIPATCIQLEE